MREEFEWWVLPIVNPDGVVIGNYRSNLQGKDMNRHFFQESDEGEQDKCTEVELIKRYLKQNLQSKKQLSMFLDIHSHSNKKSIFAFAPQPTDMHDIVRTRRFSMLLDDVSELFSMKSCSYNNSKVKKNCARLGMYKAF